MAQLNGVVLNLIYTLLNRVSYWVLSRLSEKEPEQLSASMLLWQTMIFRFYLILLSLQLGILTQLLHVAQLRSRTTDYMLWGIDKPNIMSTLSQVDTLMAEKSVFRMLKSECSDESLENWPGGGETETPL